MNNKVYRVVKYSGTLSTRKHEYVGTLEQLSEELKYELGGVKCRKPESLERRLNEHMREYRGTYWDSTYFVKEIEA